ncbi:Nuclear import receptor [Exophiala xenobiotica]|nr:Nuclear import receptor [Exophiala xenobiotica]
MEAKPGAAGGFAPVLTALRTMQSNVAGKDKADAHEFLEKFQKSSEAWNATHAILQDFSIPVEARLFAATTLKGKIIYDLHQLPSEALTPLRDSLLSLLQLYLGGPRPIRTQLCICLASLAIQLTVWKDVLSTVGTAVGNSSDGGDCLLDFLRILPEEVTEGRKINLSEEELAERTKELLEDNSTQVLNLLVSYAQSSTQAAHNPRLYSCIASWLREIPTIDVVNSPLLNEIIDAINDNDSFDAAVDCLCTMFRDTRDVDESLSVIKILYPRVINLRPMIQQSAALEDNDLMKGITRLFSEAGEAWVVLIARMPADFRELVECVLECCMRDKDREAISVTFVFWYELKQCLTLEKYISARASLADLYLRLVDVMVKHIEFPTPENGNEKDLFDGDREQEDKFRSFRHNMGDVLKDCCEVIGVTQCLTKAYALIQAWGQNYASQVSGTHVPHWQELEAPLFSLRAMGRMVSPEESSVLPNVIPLLTTVPDHEKLKFQAIMALARYTEWTAQHPETLEAQLHYVISGFNHNSPEVVQASALAFRFLGTDCQRLLGDHIPQLHQFYESVIDKLKPSSQEEVTEGVAAVVAVQPVSKIYETLKMFCDPVMSRVVSLAQQAKDENAEKTVADYLGLLTIFFDWVQPYISPHEPNPAVKYCQEILPALSGIAKHFTRSIPILERVCKCWRVMVISYRTATAPLLGTLASSIAEGFEASRQGCFLWATDAVIREFSYGAEFVDEATSDNVFRFFAQQATVFFKILTELQPVELPDVIEDFFRLASDAVRFYPKKTITSNLALPMVQASLTALTLQSLETIQAALHFLRDFLDFGFDKPPISSFSGPDGEPTPGTTPEVQAAVKQVLNTTGQQLVHRVLTGMMFSFPEDCFPDASGVLLSLFNLAPEAAAQWVQGTLQLLPAGTLKPAEANKLMKGISDKLQQNEPRKVRILLQDFTNSYRRRNVAPREGLGRLEATRFRFGG